MHPIERLRHVARAVGAPDESVLREAASSLVPFADDRPTLVTACRRLLDRHPVNGPVWWLAARMLTEVDATAAAADVVARVDADPVLDEVIAAIDPDARVCVVGWPPRLADVFARRGDVEVRVVDVEGDGPGFARLLEDLDVPTIDIDVTGMGGAVGDADLVLLESTAIGPEVAVCPSGSWPLAALASTASVPVWLVGGEGRTIGPATWPALFDRFVGATTAPWEGGADRLPLALVDRVFGRSEAIEAPELRR